MGLQALKECPGADIPENGKWAFIQRRTHHPGLVYIGRLGHVGSGNQYRTGDQGKLQRFIQCICFSTFKKTGLRIRRLGILVKSPASRHAQLIAFNHRFEQCQHPGPQPRYGAFILPVFPTIAHQAQPDEIKDAQGAHGRRAVDHPGPVHCLGAGDTVGHQHHGRGQHRTEHRIEYIARVFFLEHQGHRVETLHIAFQNLDGGGTGTGAANDIHQRGTHVRVQCGKAITPLHHILDLGQQQVG